MTLHTGAPPFFFPNPAVELDPLSPLEAYTHSSNSTDGLLNELDPELASTWRVMQHFSQQINLAAKGKANVRLSYLLDTMAGVMYRLVHMQTQRRFPPRSFNEAARLGLMGFSCGIFLQWRQIRLFSAHFPALYRDCLINSDIVSASAQRGAVVSVDGMLNNSMKQRFWVWLIMIGVLSVFPQADYHWLKTLLQCELEACGIRTWEELRDLVRAEPFLWIDVVHDHIAKKFFESMQRTLGPSLEAQRRP